MAVRLKKFHKQNGTYECWYACFLMVYDTVTDTESDYDEKWNELQRDSNVIQNYINGCGEVGIIPFEHGADAGLLAELLTEQLEGRANYIAEYTAGGQLSKEEILQGVSDSLALGLPAIIGEDWRGGGGHFCVVIDIDIAANILTIVDPNKDGIPEPIKIADEISTYIYRH